MKKTLCRLFLVAVLVAVTLFPLSVYAALEADPVYYLKYSVSKRDVTIVKAVTPYDADTKVRDAFLLWFQRGFRTVLTGAQPLMIEWRDSPEGRAGQRGYDLGMDEGVRYSKMEKTAGRPPYTVPILPGP